MLLVLSPSKSLDYETPHSCSDFSQPAFLKDSEVLVKKLRSFSQNDIAKMMELSDKLAALNVARFEEFSTPFTLKNARQALLAFKGDVYESIEAADYSRKDWAFAQAHVRILSGLYGLLRPLDLMQAYRLEMGRKLAVGKTKDLYNFWGARLSDALNEALDGHTSKVLLNLSSEEYSKAVDRKALKFPLVNVVFKEKQGDTLKIIGLFAKQARGAMANFIVRHRIDGLDGIKDFSGMKYRYEPKFSDLSSFVFVRKAS